MEINNSNLNLIDRIKMKTLKKQDDKVIEKIKRADLQELNWFLKSYISELYFDDSKIQVFKLLEDNGAFDKFKSFQISNYKGVSYENPLIVIEALKEDKNKASLLRYLRVKTGTEKFCRAIALFSNDSFDADEFISGIKDSEAREMVLDDLYESISIDNKIKVMQDMTSERRAILLGQHKIDGEEAVQLFNMIDDEKFMRKYKEDIKNFISSRKNGGNGDRLQIESANKALTLLNVFGNDMESKDIADSIITLLYDEKFARSTNYCYDIIKEYAEHIETKGMDNILYHLSGISPDKMQPFVSEYFGKISEYGLKEAFSIYKVNVANDNIRFKQFSEENPHYLYDIAKCYYGYRIVLDNNFECYEINDVLEEIPIQDRMKFSLEFKDKIEKIDQKRIIAELVRSKQGISSDEKLNKYRKFLPIEDIANLINLESPQMRMKLIASYEDLPEGVLDEVIRYAENEEVKDMSALQRIKFIAELRKNKNNHTNISIKSSSINKGNLKKSVVLDDSQQE